MDIMESSTLGELDLIPCYSMGIEVKVSRADWRAAKYKDRKTEEVRANYYSWTGTNELYYACPAGLIQPEEVSESVGLLWYNETGDLLIRKTLFFESKLPS